MDADTFLTIVEQGAGSGREGAERATHATLQTLGERLDRQEARQLAAQLPPEVAPWLATTGPAEGFDADEFVRRVAEREGTDATTAGRDARAVLDALSRAVDPREYADMVAELPSDFAPLLPRGLYVEQADAAEFLARVAGETGLGTAGARRAAEAVLETLAERIAGGEVDDLRPRLPVELHAALERGKEHSGGQARAMPVEQFVRLVAEREGVDDLAAAHHARAVFHALREAVGDEEFLDVTVELPEDYVRTLVR
jgi:uncharacterized protein (DUF2267 family)